MDLDFSSVAYKIFSFSKSDEPIRFNNISRLGLGVQKLKKVITLIILVVSNFIGVPIETNPISNNGK